MRIAIVEDEPAAVRLLSQQLDRYAQENGIELQISSFSNGMELVSSYRPEWDVILLDVEMPVMNGMEAASKIRELDREVLLIFLTNFAQYAVDSYAVRAFDYVLKPVNYPVLSMKLRRVRNLLAQRTDRSIIIRNSEGHQRMALRDIYYIEILDHTLIYHTTEGVRSATGSTTIKALEEELRNDGFARCSQGHLVNLRCADAIEKDSLRLTSGERIPISRNRKKAFLQAFLSYWGA